MSDNFKFVQAQPFSLAGSGATVGDSSITLNTFTQIDGTLLTLTDFGTKGFITIDPGNGTFEEQVSFSGVTQNANGTATLTGVKTVLMVAPYTETANLAMSHAGGAIVVVSNTSGFYNSMLSKNDDETILGTYTFTNPNYPRMDTATPPPTDDEQLATKKYVDDIAIAGAPDATNLVKGITKLSVAAASPTNPISVGDNDTRVPTQGENDALQGTSGTPSNTNRYVTNNDTSGTAAVSSVVRAATGTSIISGAWLGLVAAGDLLYANGTSTTNLERLPIGSPGQAVIANSATTAPQYRSSTSKLSTKSSATTVSNTNAETTLMSAVIPANFLSTSGYVKGRLYVTAFLENTADIEFRLRIDGNAILSQSISNSSLVDNTVGFLDFIILSSGANTQQSTWLTDLSTSAASPSATRVTTVATSSENMTTDKTLTVTMQWNITESSSSITASSGYIELTSA